MAVYTAARDEHAAGSEKTPLTKTTGGRGHNLAPLRFSVQRDPAVDKDDFADYRSRRTSQTSAPRLIEDNRRLSRLENWFLRPLDGPNRQYVRLRPGSPRRTA